MHGYSDRIHHAFAFAAKHYVPRAPATGSADFIAHPGNLAVILSRYSADQPTVVAGVLHLVLEETRPEYRPSMEQNIGIKFGSVVLPSRAMQWRRASMRAAWSFPGAP